jgi:hypothetical protein
VSPKHWDVVEVEAIVRSEGSQKAAARKLGITPQRVSQILGGQAYREASNARHRRYFAKNREAGLCSCGRQPEPGFKSCNRCRENGSRSNERKKQEAKMRPRKRRWQIRVTPSIVGLRVVGLRVVARRGDRGLWIERDLPETLGAVLPLRRLAGANQLVVLDVSPRTPEAIRAALPSIRWSKLNRFPMIGKLHVMETRAG